MAWKSSTSCLRSRTSPVDVASFSDPCSVDVKAPVDECKDSDMTYAAPLFVTAEFNVNTVTPVRSRADGVTSLMMTRRTAYQRDRACGGFASCGRPGCTRRDHKSTDKTLHSVKVILRSGARNEITRVPSCHGDMVLLNTQID